MEGLNLKELCEKINSFAEERDWDQFHSIKNLSMALSVESSELLEIFQWMTEDQSNNLSDKDLNKAKEELADIFVYLVRISSKLDVDLFEVASSKIKKNAEKYPVEKAKGNAKKYTEL